MLIGIAGLAGSGKDTAGDFIKEIIPDAQKITFAGPIKWFAARVFDFPYETIYGPSNLRNTADERLQPWDVEHHFGLGWAKAHQNFHRLRFQFATEFLCRGAGDLSSETRDRALRCLDDWFCDHILTHDKPLTVRHILQTLGTECGRRFDPDVWVNYALSYAKDPTKTYYVTDVRFVNEMAAVSGDPANSLWWITRPDSGLAGDAGLHESERYLADLTLRDLYATGTYHNDSSIGDLGAWVAEQLFSLKYDCKKAG